MRGLKEMFLGILGVTGALFVSGVANRAMDMK
jgi:hypothetical protein